MLVASVALLLMVAPARAGQDFYINVHNESPYSLKLYGGASYCWLATDLAEGAAPAIAAGTSRVIHTESRNTAFTDCFNAAKSQNLDISFQRRGSYPGPNNGAVNAADAFRYNIDYTGGWDLFEEGRTEMRGRPRAWLPFNINTAGNQDGDIKGMFCLTSAKTNFASYDIWIKAGETCIRTVSSKVSHLPRNSVAKAGRAEAGPKSGPASDIIYNLFQTGEYACNATKPYQYWGYEQCDYASNGNVWNLDNLTTDVKEVKADGDAQVVGGWTKIADQTFNNMSGGQGKQSWEYTLTKGEETETETHVGYKVGGKVSFERSWKLPVFGKTKVGFDVEVEGEWGSTEAVKKSTEKEVKQGAEVEVPEGKKVRMVVKQQQSTLATNFSADLTSGRPGLAQPIKTPVARPLGINSSRNHPCIGYLGAGSPNSIRKLSDYAYSTGMTPTDPNLSQDKKSFLMAGPNFSADNSAAARCPGFPDGFPAAFAFKGTASYKANAGGPTDAKGKFAPNLPDLQICAYGGGEGPHTLTAGDDDPCAVGSLPAVGDYGNLIEGADVPANGMVTGDPDGSYIQAGGPNDLPNGELRTYQGLLGDDILSGTVEADLLRGGSGEDVIEGKAGNDQLYGEGDNDVIKGGDGNDLLHDDDGDNWLQAGAGNDRLYSAKGATGGLFGQKGNDTLTMKGKGGVTLFGGVGNDRYRLLDGARGRGVVEFPGGGFDTVRTEGNVNLTANVERVEVIGKRGLELNGNEGDNWMIGGPGRDIIGGGRGSDLLKGKAGNDRLILQPYGLDLAIAGAGADEFVVRGTGPLGTVTSVRKRPGAKSAHLIKDLNLKQGDRIVLRPKDFNPGLRKARRGKVIHGQKARGKRPQFIYSKRSHLLTYDSDGTGPKPPAVIARIAKKKHIPLKAIRIK